MNRPTPRLPDDDETLRERLRDALRRAPADDVQALQARALQQWQQQCASGARSGPLAALQWHRRRHPLLAGGALLALGVAGVLALQSLQRPDPTLDELTQLDVLSLMSMGEL